MDAPFTRGLAWYRYKALEEEFISATKYFPFEKTYKDVWSEFFSDLLIKTCNSIDSFFRNMINVKDNKPCDSNPHIQGLLHSKRSRNINFFRDCFEPMYALSTATVDIAYGLTFYDTKVCPFSEFENNGIPAWWTAYNHVKHTWFDCIKEATLESVINALAGLFLLNVLNISSRKYLLYYQNVIKGEYLRNSSEILDMVIQSKVGLPINWATFEIVASTPIFSHKYRIDPNTVFNG